MTGLQMRKTRFYNQEPNHQTRRSTALNAVEQARFSVSRDQTRSDRKMNRRTILLLGGAISVCATLRVEAQQESMKKTLLDAPLELGDGWTWSTAEDVKTVLSRVRDVCLTGIRLLSDQQPAKLRVDNYTEWWPHVRLHADPPDMAWIFLNVPLQNWSQLACQFGHELGHVFCNSWGPSAEPGPPTQWLEEAMVEAFTMRGLGLLASSWEKSPPFDGDQAFATKIREHRAERLKLYSKQGDQDIVSWFRGYRSELESGRPADKDPAVLKILPILENEQTSVEDLGAVNRWPARTRVPIEEYLSQWDKSCTEIAAYCPVVCGSSLRLAEDLWIVILRFYVEPVEHWLSSMDFSAKTNCPSLDVTDIGDVSDLHRLSETPTRLIYGHRLGHHWGCSSGISLSIFSTSAERRQEASRRQG
jgi:hypothetical protein